MWPLNGPQLRKAVLLPAVVPRGPNDWALTAVTAQNRPIHPHNAKLKWRHECAVRDQRWHECLTGTAPGRPLPNALELS